MEMTKEKLVALVGLMKGFSINLPERKLNLLFYSAPDGFFSILLELHYVSECGELENIKDEGRSARVEMFTLYSDLNGYVESMIGELTKRVLAENGSATYSFFDQVSKHFKCHISDTLYINSLANIVLPETLNTLTNQETGSQILRKAFPIDWKITENNLKSNLISRFCFQFFYELIGSKITAHRNGPDYRLDRAISELFPSVDPILLATYFIFIFNQEDEKTKLSSIINSEWPIGVFGRMLVVWGETSGETLDKQYKDLEEETYKLIWYINENLVRFFDIRKLNQYKSELDSQEGKYTTDQNKGAKYRRLLRLIEGLLDWEAKANATDTK